MTQRVLEAATGLRPTVFLDIGQGSLNDDLAGFGFGLFQTPNNQNMLLSAPEQRALVRLTYEAFLRSVSRDPGPWQGYAAETARDWLDLLVRAQPETPRALAEARATRALALIRGLLLDLLASDDPERVTAAVHAGHWDSASTRT